MKIEDIDILTLIPQRRPFVLIDRLLHYDDVVTISEFTIRGDHLFFENGSFQKAGIVENIAQTCAARIGYKNSLTSNDVLIGFIGAIRNLEIKRSPKENECLTTTITIIEEVFNMTLVEAKVRVKDEEIASAMMKIALSDIKAEVC